MRPIPRRVRLAALLLALGVWLVAAGAVAADSPLPSQDPIGDARAGQEASFVGNPGLAIAVVVVIAVASVAVTLLWIRVTGGPADPSEGR